MQWASNFLWHMARQSFILPMPTEGFVSASSSSFFSLILLLLCPKSGNWAAASSRKGITSWRFCQIIHLEYPKTASDQPLQQLLLLMTGNYLPICGAIQSHLQIDFKQVTRNLNLFNFNSQVLRCQGVDTNLIGVKECILKPRSFVLWTPRKEHTESAIRKDHLAPCRFKCWTNQISIGISQPLAQLQCRYNVEIPRVSLPNDHDGAKWDFRTDRAWSHDLLAWGCIARGPSWSETSRLQSRKKMRAAAGRPVGPPGTVTGMTRQESESDGKTQ
jgi:hypothetical protein